MIIVGTYSTLALEMRLDRHIYPLPWPIALAVEDRPAVYMISGAESKQTLVNVMYTYHAQVPMNRNV